MAAIRKDVRLSLGPLFKATVSVLAAVDNEEEEVAFNNVCTGAPGAAPHAASGCGSTLTCKFPGCGNDDKATFQKGRKIGDTYVILSQADIAGAAVDESLKASIELTAHRTEDLTGSVLNGDKVYYLAPSKTDEGIYALFVALVDNRPDLTFCAIWASRTKPAMYRLTTFSGALALQKIAWPSQIRETPEVNVPIDDKMLAMANQLAEMTLQPFDASTYKDSRAEMLKQYIAAAEGVPGAVLPSVAKSPAPAGNSLADMLQAALAAAAPTAPAKKAPTKTPSRPATPAPVKKVPAKRPAKVA